MDESPRTDASRPSQVGHRNGGEPVQDREVSGSASGEGWPPRWLTPVAPADLRRSLGEIVADFAEDLVPIAKDSIAGSSGEPIQFRIWQRRLLRRVLARKEDETFTHRFYLVGIARKNGKTALASTLPLFFGLYGDKGGEIYSAAADRAKLGIAMVESQSRIDKYRDRLAAKDGHRAG